MVKTVIFFFFFKSFYPETLNTLSDSHQKFLLEWFSKQCYLAYYFGPNVIIPSLSIRGLLLLYVFEQV